MSYTAPFTRVENRNVGSGRGSLAIPRKRRKLFLDCAESGFSGRLGGLGGALIPYDVYPNHAQCNKRLSYNL